MAYKQNGWSAFTKKTDIEKIKPTSQDTLRSHIYDNIPGGPMGMVARKITKIDDKVLEQARDSNLITPNMSSEDFERAKKTLNLKTNSEVVKELTGKNKKDLPWILQKLIK